MRYRVTRAAQADIAAILTWSDERFGTQAAERYRALIAAGIRDAASRADAAVGLRPRPELGEGVFSWHLSQSRGNPGTDVSRPRHFLICRRDGDLLIVGRVLHDAMDLRRHVAPE